MEMYSFKTSRSVNQAVCVFGLFYFLYFGGFACLIPFITLYFRQLGLSASQVGIICGSKSIAWVLIAPVWISCAQSLQKVKIALAVTVFAAIIGNISISFVSPASEKTAFTVCMLETHSLNPPSNNNCKKFSSSKIIVTSPSLPRNTTIIPNTVTKATPYESDVDHSFVLPNKNVEELSTSSNRFDYTTTFKNSSFQYVMPSSINFNQNSRVKSPYQMALYLLPRVNDLKLSEQDIQNFILQLDEIQNWPYWKQRVLAQKVIGLLNKKKYLHNKSFYPSMLTDSSNLRSKKFPIHQKSSSEVNEVAERLFPLFLVKKERSPTLTITEFLKSYPKVNAFPKYLQYEINKLLQSVWHEYQNKFHYRRNRRDVALYDFNGNPKVNSKNVVFTNRTNYKNVQTIIFDKITTNLKIFFWILFIVLATEIMSAPINLLSDNSIYDWLEEMESLKLYGKHRIFALIATACAGLLITIGIYYLPCNLFGVISKFRLHFYAFTFFAGLSLLLVPIFPTVDYHFPQRSRNLVLSLCPLLKIGMFYDCRRALLFCTVVIVGMFHAVEQNFLLWQVQDLPSSSYLIYGFIVSGNAVAAIFAIFVGKKIFRKLKSHFIFPASLLCIALKFAIYSFLKQPWLFVPVQILNVFGIPLFWLAVESEINLVMTRQDKPDWLKRNDQVQEFFKSSQKRKLYIAYSCAYQGLGFFFGSVLCGITYDVDGETLVRVFRLGAGILLIWSVVHIVCQQCCVKKVEHRRYLTLFGESDDEEDIYKATEKQMSKGFEAKSKHFERTKIVGSSRKKRRNRKPDQLNLSQEELEQDWNLMSLRKEGKIV